MTKRRTIIGTLALALVGLITPQALAADSAGDGTRRPVLDLSRAIDQTTTVDLAASLPAQAVGIGPGSHLLTTIPGPDGGTFGCTASYVYASGSELFLAAAGHCFLPEGTTATAGRDVDHNTSGTVVKVCVASCSFGGASGFIITGQLKTLGAVVYARQEESRGGEQVGHDFGLVRIPTSLHSQVRTSMPVFGGPASVGTLQTGEQVCHYGNGVVLGEVFPTMGRTGLGIVSGPKAWFAATAAAPGDSGSAVQTCAPTADGLTGVEAIGTLTHLTDRGTAGTTNAQSVAMASRDAKLSIALVLGAAPTAGSPTAGGGGKGGPKR